MVGFKNLIAKSDQNKSSKHDVDHDLNSEACKGKISKNREVIKDRKTGDTELPNAEVKPKRVQFGQKLKELKKNLHFYKKKIDAGANIMDGTMSVHSSKNANKHLTRKMSYPPTHSPTRASISHYSYSGSKLIQKDDLDEQMVKVSNSEVSQNGSMNEYSDFLNIGQDERRELHMHVNFLINNEDSEESTEETDSFCKGNTDFIVHPHDTQKKNGRKVIYNSPEENTLKQEYDDDDDDDEYEDDNITGENETFRKKIGNIYNETYAYTKNFVSHVYVNNKIFLNDAYENVSQYRMPILDAPESLLDDYDTANEEQEESQDSSVYETTMDRVCGYIIFFMTSSLLFDIPSI